ncbi:MAG: PQQ-binding-like beta-propeller repeat protein [Haloarculaceae archaeon]
MTPTRDRQTIPLGAVPPTGSRHQGRRSAVALTDDLVVAGTADGSVRAFDRESLTEIWQHSKSAGSVVSTATTAERIAVGERGPAGAVRLYDAAGDVRWRYETATDVGEPQKDTRFFLPFVVDVAATGSRVFVAARRYERRGERPEGERRHFESVVYAFESDGTVAWRYETDGSPIALDTGGDRLAVAYNRCTGDHQRGLVVLDTGDGGERWSWDPGTDGQRRVGDVTLLDAGAVVTGHGDYRGYALDEGGDVRWRADLATPREIDGETVYAYPNHVHATSKGVLFVTGNTYPEEGRETDVLHPEEHTAFGYGPAGERQWTDPVGGFASGIDACGRVVAVPCAQNFRQRDADVHACRLFEVRDGRRGGIDTAGVATAAALDESGVAVVEEPVRYHDEGTVRGEYALHVADRP